METARVYVGTWKKYNEGNLSGAWLDLTKYANYQEFVKACHNIHADESDAEFMIQDAELPDGHSLSSNEWLYEDDFNDIIQEIKDSEKEDEENFEGRRFRTLATMGRQAQESGKAIQHACTTIQLSN